MLRKLKLTHYSQPFCDVICLVFSSEGHYIATVFEEDEKGDLKLSEVLCSDNLDDIATYLVEEQIKWLTELISECPEHEVDKFLKDFAEERLILEKVNEKLREYLRELILY